MKRDLELFATTGQDAGLLVIEPDTDRLTSTSSG